MFNCWLELYSLKVLEMVEFCVIVRYITLKYILPLTVTDYLLFTLQRRRLLAFIPESLGSTLFGKLNLYGLINLSESIRLYTSDVSGVVQVAAVDSDCCPLNFS